MLTPLSHFIQGVLTPVKGLITPVRGVITHVRCVITHVKGVINVTESCHVELPKTLEDSKYIRGFTNYTVLIMPSQVPWI